MAKSKDVPCLVTLDSDAPKAVVRSVQRELKRLRLVAYMADRTWIVMAPTDAVDNALSMADLGDFGFLVVKIDYVRSWAGIHPDYEAGLHYLSCDR